MKNKKIITTALTLFTLAVGMNSTALAAVDRPVPLENGQISQTVPLEIQDNNSRALLRSYNSSFNLDFGQAQSWTLDFDNNSTAIFNHSNVTVKYLSNTPMTEVGKVTVELWIDEDKDGTYERYDSSGGYLYTLDETDSAQISLPYGNTVKNYRLVFVNKNSKVTSASFSVKTH